MAAEPCEMTQRDKLVSQLREAQDDDEAVDSILKRAKFESSPHSLGFERASGSSDGNMRWSAIVDDLNALGLTFGEVVSTSELLLRVVAYDAKEDKMWGTYGRTEDKLAYVKHWSGKPYTRVASHSARDATVRALEGADDDTEYAQLLEIAERELARVKRSRELNGLRFHTKREYDGFSTDLTLFSWESMTTELEKRGYAFGDVVVDGRRAIAFRGDVLWVAASAPRVNEVEKL